MDRALLGRGACRGGGNRGNPVAVIKALSDQQARTSLGGTVLVSLSTICFGAITAATVYFVTRLFL